MRVQSICSVSVMVAALFAASPALAGTVEVVLTDVRPDAGDLYVGLQTEDQFLKDGGVAGEIVENPQTGTVTVTLRDLPDGRYSLSVWHDIDGDKTFSMGSEGPTDGWAMVGGAELRGMPVFEQQSFIIDGGPVTIRERMIYGREER